MNLGAKLCRSVAGAPEKWSGPLALLGLYTAFYLLIETPAILHPRPLCDEPVPSVAEAAALLENGWLELDRRYQDTALFDGRVYNVYPPMYTAVAWVVLRWWPLATQTQVVFLLALPLPGLAYALFRRRTGGVWPAVVLTATYLFGTSLWPVLSRALADAQVYHVNHLLAQLGLLVFLLDYFGRRRIWLGGLGLLVAGWSRQLTAFYWVALVYAAWAGATARPHRGWRLAVAGVVALLLAGVPLLLNTLKFGHPLDTGYRHLYAGVGTAFAADVLAHGLFGLRYVPRNLYFMNLGLPVAIWINGFLRLRPNPYGTGIWWTTPVLAYLWRDGRQLWSRPAERVLLAVVPGVVVGLLLYHATGYWQPGYNRFSLDYIVVVLALLAPYCFEGRRRRLTPLLAGWSVWYFRWAI